MPTSFSPLSARTICPKSHKVGVEELLNKGVCFLKTRKKRCARGHTTHSSGKKARFVYFGITATLTEPSIGQCTDVAVRSSKEKSPPCLELSVVLWSRNEPWYHDPSERALRGLRVRERARGLGTPAPFSRMRPACAPHAPRMRPACAVRTRVRTGDPNPASPEEPEEPTLQEEPTVRYGWH